MCKSMRGWVKALEDPARFSGKVSVCIPFMNACIHIKTPSHAEIPAKA